MNRNEWSRFRPVFAFVGRFLGIYIIASLLYGWMVVSYRPNPDPVTHEVTFEVAALLRWAGYDVLAYETQQMDTVNLFWNNRTVVSVYEGCNGVNVMIVWLAFLFAMGPWDRRMLLFSFGGVGAIYLLNLFRVSLLFLVSAFWPKQFYFFHKYLFTAFLYVFVFVGWLWWLRSRTPKSAEPDHDAESLPHA